MTDRKFHLTEFRIRVLAEDAITSVGALEGVLNGTAEGVWCSREPVCCETLNGREAADQLRKMGATPELFNLTKDGDDCA